MFRQVSGRLKLAIGHNRVVVRSCAIFGACVLLSAFAYSRLVEADFFAVILAFTARATGFFLNLLGCGAAVSGVSVSSSDFSVDIGTGCTGLVPIMIFICAVLAYPAKIKAKAIGIPLGIFCLYSLNILRTVSLFFIGAHFYTFFDIAHLLVWQSLMILSAIVLWLFWVGRMTHVQAH